MQDLARFRVPPERLCWQCEPSQFPFDGTDQLSPPEEFIGQERATRAITVGLELEKPGFNVFVTGISGMGKASVIQAYLGRYLARKVEEGALPRPSDWVFVYNFADPDRPRAIRLPAGKGRLLRDKMNHLINQLHPTLQSAFSSDLYEAERKQILEQANLVRRQIHRKVEEVAQVHGFMVQQTPEGIAIVPVFQGRPLPPEALLAMREEDREALEARRVKVMEALEQAIKLSHSLERQVAERIKRLNQQVASMALADLLGDLEGTFRDIPEVLDYIAQVRQFVLDHLEVYLSAERQQGPSLPFPGPLAPLRLGDPFLPFRVNLFVDNSQTEGVPVVYETSPNYGNLFGRMERRFVLGAFYTDHTMIKAGAISRANGGFLILNARDALMYPGVWEALKRVLKSGELRIEDSPLEQFGLIAPVALKPEPIPTQVKVILVAEPALYYLLYSLDPEVWKLFKVRADFDYQVDRTPEVLMDYARVFHGLCHRHSLLHLDRTGLARLLEHASRMVDDQEKLSSRFGVLQDVLMEADYWARKEGAPYIQAPHVRRALEERFYRSSLLADRIRELIAQGTILVEVEGEVVGQVNGLVVRDLGDIRFAHPSRITARTFMGQAGVVNIERESRLSGRIHDKGVLILSGYLGWKYAQDKPLSLSATLGFEQSYEGVEGDSASSAELYAILSSLSGLPIKQGIAVTGSVNQRGEIQPIGGVNEKIEGFYEVCKAKDLTGEQGVLIPAANLRHLMLKEEVVDAVRQGRFHIYAVRTVDEGISILTGVPAGEPGPDGRYSEGTVNFLVEQRLRQWAEAMRGYQAPPAEQARPEEGPQGEEKSPPPS